MSSITEKKCSKCGITKKATEFREEKRNTSTGLRSYCNKCEDSARTENRRKDPEKARITAKIYRDKNRDRINEQQKARYPLYAIAQRLFHKIYYQENKEVMKENARQYAKDNAEEKKVWQREYYHNNIEHSREMRRIYGGNRRSNMNGTYTVKEWKDLCDKYDNCCLKCGERKKLTVDHVLPVSLGGANTIDNLQPLCKSCNSSKGTKHIDYR